MENFDWLSLIYNTAPAIVGGLLVAFWGRIEKVLKAFKELSDVLTVITESLADQNLSKEELEQIKIEGKEALAAFKAILK